MKPAYKYLPIAITLAMTAVIYGSGLTNDMLHFDDNRYFNDYPEITNLSWAGFKTIFTSHYVLMYQPLPVLSFALNYAAFGENPVPYHLFGLLLHLANILVVYALSKAFLKQWWQQILAVAIFAFHPMNVEAVAWVSATSSGMYGLFYLLAIWMYVRHGQEQTIGRYVLITALFLLSLLSKAQAVTLPVLLFAVDWFLGRKWNWKLLAEKTPWLAMSLFFGWLALQDNSTIENIKGSTVNSFELTERFFLVTYSYAFYLIKFIAPTDLSAVYVYPNADAGNLPLAYYLSPIVLIALTLPLLLKKKWFNYAVFGLGWFLISITLNIQFVSSRLFIVTDRYGYIPYLGLTFLLCWILGQLIKTKISWKHPIALASGVWLIVFAVASFNRVQVWANNEIFMKDMIAKNEPVPYLARAHGILGLEYLEQNKPTKALNAFNQAIELNPKDHISLGHRGRLRKQIGDIPGALADLEAAYLSNPHESWIPVNIGVIHFEAGRMDLAEEAFTVALELDPNNLEARSNLGSVYFHQQKYEKALQQFTIVTQTNPADGEAFNRKGYLENLLGDPPQACSTWTTGAQLGNQGCIRNLEEICN